MNFHDLVRDPWLWIFLVAGVLLLIPWGRLVRKAK